MDCIEGLKQIPDKSVNMYFVDLPYGVTTKNKWDNIIPPEPMWEQIERTLKDNGVILFFGQDKFTAKMMLSNEKNAQVQYHLGENYAYGSSQCKENAFENT